MVRIEIKTFLMLLFTGLFMCSAINGQDKKDEPSSSTVIYAGTRSSSYGVRPFPSVNAWEKAFKTMSSYYQGSEPAAVWIVGEMASQNSCRLYFPSDGKTYDNIIFNDTDKHESFLNHFDSTGIKVFLQVESANADMLTLIDLVLSRYKHHPCVIGFGVDVEWYRVAEKPGWGVNITDAEAELWEKKVKSYNPDYQLFLKHWDRDWMPPKYRGDIIFVNDSQQHAALDSMVYDFDTYWADYFNPNTVAFQIGYKSDMGIWGQFPNPPEDLGKLLSRAVKQKCCIFWVDFSLRDVKLITE